MLPMKLPVIDFLPTQNCKRRKAPSSGIVDYSKNFPGLYSIEN